MASIRARHPVDNHRNALAQSGGRLQEHPLVPKRLEVWNPSDHQGRNLHFYDLLEDAMRSHRPQEREDSGRVLLGLDVEAVGWQDFSDSSHHGCFRFD